ncbi:MAG TPA: glycine cleavage T C-terminal barrel domain-containing protein [Vicinamibacterales bacterium]|nr:glycine cleavage T C-terminal barrel domain-containing protein [Vicinamibacterales bacterium]
MSANRISLEDYTTARQGAFLGAISARAQIAVAGKDRASYLQGLLTNDIAALGPDTGCYAAWLTPQGRMLTDLHVLQSDDMILLDVPAELAETILQRLDQFLFGEDVQLASLAGNLQPVWIHGQSAPGVLARVVADAPSFDAWRDYQHARLAFQSVPVVVARINQLGVPGFCLYAAADQADALVASLQANGAAAVDQALINAMRVEEGYPIFGLDMTDDTIPLEAGIEARAISFTKGCYVGQEVVIRVLHRGGGRVARRLVGLRSSADMAAGAKLFAGEREIGFVTSAATSPALGPIALGYVHRDFTSPGTDVSVDGAGGRATVAVTERPIAS